MPNKLQQEIASFLSQYDAAHYFIAVSGGMDSMLLLELVSGLNSNLTVLHVNYHLRGEESEADQAFVQAYCHTKGIPCMVHSIQLSDKLKYGGNLQQLARDERYAFFKQHLEEIPQARLLVAHHQDDQFETFWLQLFRGSGMSGLKGMRAENGRILRPLLPYSKKELSTYAKSISLKWREDSSNQKTTYQRNALRLKRLPELQKKIPTLRDSVLYLQQLFQEHLTDFESTLSILIESLKNTGTITLSDISQIHDYQSIELIKRIGIPTAHLDAFLALISAETGKKITWRNTESGLYHAVIRERESLRFIRASSEPVRMPKFHIKKVTRLPANFSKHVLYLDADHLNGALHVRPWKIGDRIYPIGLNGSKLISDILKDAKVQHSEKKQQFVLCDDEKILACIGYCIDRRAIAKNESREILRIDFNINW
jgi:tRNA(Ile)-lysidine synthase